MKKETGFLGGYVVYNREPGLTHILENGHVIRNQSGTYGRVSGRKHIAPAEQAGVMQYELLCKSLIEGIG